LVLTSEPWETDKNLGKVAIAFFGSWERGALVPRIAVFHLNNVIFKPQAILYPNEYRGNFFDEWKFIKSPEISNSKNVAFKD